MKSHWLQRKQLQWSPTVSYMLLTSSLDSKPAQLFSEDSVFASKLQYNNSNPDCVICADILAQILFKKKVALLEMKELVW